MKTCDYCGNTCEDAKYVFPEVKNCRIQRINDQINMIYPDSTTRCRIKTIFKDILHGRFRKVIQRDKR